MPERCDIPKGCHVSTDLSKAFKAQLRLGTRSKLGHDAQETCLPSPPKRAISARTSPSLRVPSDLSSQQSSSSLDCNKLRLAALAGLIRFGSSAWTHPPDVNGLYGTKHYVITIDGLFRRAKGPLQRVESRVTTVTLQSKVQLYAQRPCSCCSTRAPECRARRWAVGRNCMMGCCH